VTHSYVRHDLLTAVGLGECVLQGVLYRGPSSGAGVCVEREGGVCVESEEAEEEMIVERDAKEHSVERALCRSSWVSRE